MERSLQTDLSEIEKREGLKRVLSSTTFHRSDQLRSLLKYVCDCEIQGEGETLSEYTVAIGALGRPRDYSALEDGSVRNRIHTLRRRLEHYYEIENPQDPVRIEIPKGSYCPSFLRRPAVESMIHPAVEPVIEHLPPSPAGFWNRQVRMKTVILLAGVAFVIAVVAAWLGQRSRSSIDPVIAEAWGPLVSPGGKPLICLATAAQLTLIQRPMDPPAPPTIHSPDLLAWYNSQPGLPPAKQIYLGPSLTSPFWVDLAAAFI